MDPPSRMTYIKDAPEDPVEMFSNLISAYKKSNPDIENLTINIATIDDEFGALNRVVVCRGLVDDHIVFVTETNTRKFINIMKDPRVSITFFFENVDCNGINAVWQVRIFGKAELLSSDQISKLYNEESVLAKIRSRICECGKPVEFEKLKEAHDKLLEAYESGQDSLPQTSTYTALKIIPTTWDFYKSQSKSIADRVQYRREKSDGDKWRQMHVAC